MYLPTCSLGKYLIGVSDEEHKVVTSLDNVAKRLAGYTKVKIYNFLAWLNH